MTAITNDWTLQEYAADMKTPVGKPQTLAALGIENAEYELPNLAPDVMTFTVGGRAINAGILWPYGTTLALIDPFGTRQFFGRIEPWSLTANGAEQNHMGRLVNPFWYLDKLMYQQNYTFAATRDANGKPLTYGPTYTTPRVVLNILYSAANVPPFFQATTGQQIADTINWAIAQGAPIKLGVTDPATKCFSDFQKGITCAEVIKKEFRIEPDFVMDWDYTTLPFPTVHFRKMASLKPLLIDLIDGVYRDQITIKSRPDWQRSYVRIYYDETEVIGPITALLIAVDQYPAVLPQDIESKFRGVDLFCDLSGVKVSQTSQTATLTTVPFDINNLALWKVWVPELADPTVTDVVLLTDNSKPKSDGDYPDASIQTWQELDSNGDPIDYDPANACELVEGEWNEKMVGITAQRVRATASFQITSRVGNDPKGNIQTISKSHDFTAISVNTNGIPTDYLSSTSQVLQGAEAQPPGLAQNMWTSWQNVAIEGSFRNVENIIGQNVKISRSNSLIFMDGDNAVPDWIGKTALIQRITGNIAQGALKVEFGAPLHLTGHELVDAIRVARFRVDVSVNLAYLFGGALSDAGASVRSGRKTHARHSQGSLSQIQKQIISAAFTPRTS